MRGDPTLGPEQAWSAGSGEPALIFQDLLAAAGLPLRTTRLVRHREVRHGRAADAMIRSGALTLSPFFLRYQAVQGGPAYRDASHIASFVGGPANETAFVGVWAVGSLTAEHFPDPFRPTEIVDGFVYELTHEPRFDGYRGRLFIDWGEGTRAWIQRAERQPKRVVAFLPYPEQPFPGWSRLRVNLAEVPGLPHGWQQVLRASRGVYLVVHAPTGAQYVGAAAGGEGFLGRWLAYSDGIAGNLGLRELGRPAEEYEVSVLWVASSRDGEDEILEQEAFEKDRLGSRSRGLNRN